MALGFDAAGRLLRAVVGDEPQAAGTEEYLVPGYVIDHKLGRGSGGAVYRAFRNGSDRPLALKILGTHVGQDVLTQRAWRELQILETLRLPNVPRLIDYGLHRGRMYIATEMVEGQSLEEYAGARRPNVRACVEMMAKVADAVQSLHEHGVIHRDIKPANIIIDPQGEPVIVDMGIATLAANRSSETISPEGAPMGTPAFMAPEQARGEQANVSTRADVYGLGATTCWVLTGQTPFDTECPVYEAVRRVAQDLPRHPRDLAPSLPRTLAEVIAKAIEAEPAKRFASAAGFAADLRRWLKGDPVLAAPPMGWARFAGWIGRHPIASTVTVCSLVVALTLLATFKGLVWLDHHPHEMVLDPTQSSRVDLVTTTGRPIATWEGRGRGSVQFAGLLRDTPERGTHKAVIAWGLSAENSLRGLLCGYSTTTPDQPLWTKGVGGKDLVPPRPLADGVDNSFRCSEVFFADVFRESAGLEIVALHLHQTKSPAAIRVYSPLGEVLYEVWHDGPIYAVTYVPGPGLVVAYAANCDRRWSELGFSAVREAWPSVAFGVRPKFGISEPFLRTPHGTAGTAVPEWYKFLRPASACDVFPAASAKFQLTTGVRGADRLASLALHRRDGSASGTVVLIIDERGLIAKRSASETFPRADLSWVEDLSLDDLPPPTPSSGGT